MASSPRYEIQVKVNGLWYYLETFDYNKPVSFQYQISDIVEIDKRKASYSKTINLPLTANNRQVIGDLTNLASDSSFNPNLKAECIIMVNTIPVFQGNLQITNATIDDIKNKTEIEVVVFSENDDFFKNVGEKYLSELDFSYLNHYWNKETIAASWNATASWSNTGYFYPMIDYGWDWNTTDIQKLQAGHFFPAIYVKRVLDQIFHDAGYTYQSKFFNSDKFKNLIIPFCRDKVEQVAEFDNYLFLVGLSATQSVYSPPPFSSQAVVSYAEILFNDENYPYADPNNLYNTTTHRYVAPAQSLSYVQRFNLNFDFIELPLSNTWQEQRMFGFKREFDPFTNTAPNSGFPITINGQAWFVLDPNNPGGPFSITTLPGGGRQFKGSVSSDWLDGHDAYTLPLQPGEKVWVVFKRFCQNTYISPSTLILPGTSFSNSCAPNVAYVGAPIPFMAQGMKINMNKVLPEKIKQKDFLTSLIKMFNLYIEPSKDWPTSLIVEPRDDYYASGTIEDWTKKIDLNTPIDEQILSDTQYKTIRATYKEDKDYYNDDYFQRSNFVYGEYREEIENDFIVDELLIKTAFSATPIISIPGSTEFPIPKIGKLSNNVFSKTTFNIRILTKYTGGLLPLESPNTDKWKFENVSYSSYPYAGHFDNPYDPDYDLNFGQVLGLYYAETDVTNDNLIQLYYRRQFDEVNDKNAKIITCEMWLTPTDIYNFRFNKKIFLDIGGNGQYWRVQSITNYDPGSTGTCTVVLMKIKDITIKKKKTLIRNIVQSQAVAAVAYGNFNTLLGSAGVVAGNSNTTGERSYTITGNNNAVQSANTSIVGDLNTTMWGSTNVNITGDGNFVDGEVRSASITGDNNYVAKGSERIVLINAQNIETDASDQVIISGSIIKYTNFIDAGENEVLNPFPTTELSNYVDGSVDAVRNLGTQNPVMLFDSGQDAALLFTPDLKK